MSLELSGVTFAYPRAERPVVVGCDLTVERGESVALVGPSGVGKSTLLALAGLLLQPQAGTVRIDGNVRTTRDLSRSADDVSWILQSVNLLPRRSVADNVALPGIVSGLRREDAHARAAQLLERVGLAGLDDRDARTLSGGQAQRVGIARALMPSPCVLLADEPTANLDPETALAVGSSLMAATSNTALLIATHDPQIAGLCDRVLPWEELAHASV